MGLFSRIKKNKATLFSFGKLNDGSTQTAYSSGTDSSSNNSEASSPQAAPTANPSVYANGNVVADSIQKAAVVREWYTKMNEHDLDGARWLVTLDFCIVFHQDTSSQKMVWYEFYNECQDLFEAFPDYKISRTGMEAKDEASCNGNDSVVVIVQGVATHGTHTGTPYAFGADSDPIEPTGKLVQSDPASAHFHFRKDKICKVEVHPKKGQVAGPAGIYIKLGGFPPL